MPGDLTRLLLDLLSMPCVTGEEDEIADWVAARYEERELTRVGRSLVAGAAESGRPTVLLVGHLDVVPPTPEDLRPRREGDVVVGRGASDMKSGLAVAMDCFEDPALTGGPYAVRLVAYAGEEGPHSGNELGAVLDAVPSLRDAALAIVLEPTDLEVQLGCLGALNAHVTVRGRAAHSARPWHGESAIANALDLLADLVATAPRDVRVDGLDFREVVTPTQLWTDNARNVVPDTLTINVNHRFAPDREVAEAEARLTELVAGRGEIAVVDRAPAAPPNRDSALVTAFTSAVGAPVRPKQAWTDVARLAAAGIPALNYGPGATAQAHQAGERVSVADVTHARQALGRFLAEGL